MAIENMTTNKDEGSSAFGERLLGNVRETNRAKEKAFRRREDRKAQQAKIMEIGTGVGLGVVNSVIGQKTQDLLATEAAAGNVLATRTAYQFSTEILAEEKKARAYEKGYDAYWRDLGKARAQTLVDKDIAEKTGSTFYYNEYQKDLALLGQGTRIGTELRKSHENRVTANTNYMSSVGVEDGRDAYITAIKATQPQNVTDVVGNLMKKFLGMSPDEQISSTAANILKTSKELNTFQEAYKKSGNAVYSEIIAKEMSDIDYGAPIPEMSGEVKSFTQPSSYIGGKDTERFYTYANVLQRDGSKKPQLMMLDTNSYLNDGKTVLTGEVTTLRQIQTGNDFIRRSVGIASDETAVAYYKETINKTLKPESVEYINKQITEKLEADEIGTGGSLADYSKRQTALENGVYGRIGAAGISIAEKTGMDIEQAVAVAVNIWEKEGNISVTSKGAFENGAGQAAPFETLLAIQTTVGKNGTARFSEPQYREFAGKESENFIEAYLNGTFKQREAMKVNLAELIDPENQQSNVSIPVNELSDSIAIAEEIRGQRDDSVSLDEQIKLTRTMLVERQKEERAAAALEKKKAEAARKVAEKEEALEEQTATDLKDAPFAGMALQQLTPPSSSPTGKLDDDFEFNNARTWSVFKTLDPQEKLYIEIKEGIRLLKEFEKPGALLSRGINPANKKEAIEQMKIELGAKYQAYGEEYGFTGDATQRQLGTRQAGMGQEPIKEQAPSLLSAPVSSIPESVENKIEYVGKLLGDNENNIEFMKRVINQESRFGKHEGTYNISADGKGSFGVAQVDKVAFDAVQAKLKDPDSKYHKYVKAVEDATGTNLTEVEYKDLGDDTLSILFGRIYLMQITEEPIPDTIEGQAAYWKKYYNTEAGKGKASQFIRNNT